jgi:hypothetical protein
MLANGMYYISLVLSMAMKLALVGVLWLGLNLLCFFILFNNLNKCFLYCNVDEEVLFKTYLG